MSAITNDVASVGSQSVSAKEFQSAYRNYMSRMSGQISPEMLKAFRFERQILDSLIMRHVITEEAKTASASAFLPRKSNRRFSRIRSSAKAAISLAMLNTRRSSRRTISPLTSSSPALPTIF